MTRLMTSAEFEREIGALAGLPRSDLVERWRTFYRTAPPKCTSRRLLVGAIAFAMQAKIGTWVTRRLPLKIYSPKR